MILHHIPKKKSLLFIGDLALISFSFYLAPIVRLGQPIYFDELSDFITTPVIILSFIIFFYLLDLYDLKLRYRSVRYILRFLAANLLATLLIAAVYFFDSDQATGRGVLLIGTGFVCMLAYLWRLSFKTVLRKFFPETTNTVLIGYGWEAETLLRVLKGLPNYHLIEFVDIDPEKHEQCGNDDNCAPLARLIATHKIDLLITAVEHIECVTLLRNVLDCKLKGIDVCNMPSFYEEAMGKLPVEHLNDYWFVSSRLLGVNQGLYNRKIKRLLDIGCSLAILILGLPIILLTAVAIKLDSKGPVFYRQARVGLNDDVFEIVKFRSMRTDAEKDGAVWARQDDDRVSRVGRFIRKTRIDEIPQIWNVFKGEMSFIGPRPERPEFVKVLEEKIPYYSLRHSVKPGITGWAQVNYPYGASEKDALEKLEYDLFYLKNLIPSLDFHIMLKTLKVVLFGQGAR